MSRSILQPWVETIGLRHQGVLLSAIRGCDTVGKENPSKLIVRALRAAVLNAHCGDATKAVSYITVFSEDDFEALADAFYADFDHLPMHYILHLTHAAEVLGYHHPEHYEGCRWARFYATMCRKMHVNPETREQLDRRLNASESEFKAAQ
jgi:hypothetical protein